jgi:hypothetical protein
MKQARPVSHSLLLSFLIALLLGACAVTPFSYEPLDTFNVIERAQTKQKGAFEVKASVPGENEAAGIFGIPIYKRGIQPVWLEITNNSNHRARFTLSSVDREYFSPLEVAYMHKALFSKKGWQDMEAYFHRSAMPRQIPPRETVSGFVFTHLDQGTKAFNVELFYTDSNVPQDLLREDMSERFTFFITVPGFVPDHAEVDFPSLYPPESIQDVTEAGLRTLLETLPCCTTNSDGSRQGKPVNLLLVANGIDLLQALLRAGWAETSFERNAEYLNAADHFFGRPPDAIFRRGRDKTTERIEMGLWLAPVRVDGKGLWAAQLKHAIGRRYELGELFLGVKLDPDANDGRNYLLQNIWYSHSLEAFAWSRSGKRVPESAPEFDFNDNPWFSDGFRLVLWISGETIALMETESRRWDAVVDAKGELP